MKKILAILLALLLVLVNVAALAEDVVNILDDNNKLDAEATKAVSLDITKSFETVGDTALVPAQTINFTVEKWKITEATDTTAWPTADPTISVVNVVEGQTAGDEEKDEAGDITNIGAAKMTINLPAYAATGIYWYKIYEVNAHVAGMTYTYETNPLYLKVTVWNDNGTLKLGGVALRTTESDGRTETTDEEGNTTVTYADKIDDVDNKYTAGQLVIDKTVTGKLGDWEKEFTFTVKFTSKEYSETSKDEDGNETTVTDNEKVKSTITVEDTGTVTGAKFEGAAITGTTVLSATEWKGEKEVTVVLKHGQAVTFSNIPSNVSYEVTETDYSTEGYTTTDNGTADGSTASDRIVSGTITNAKAEAKYTNDKDDTPDMGVSLETLPFVLLMGIALAGVVVLSIRRREDY